MVSIEENQLCSVSCFVSDGKNFNIAFYNLDMIISLGYRIKSLIATKDIINYDLVFDMILAILFRK